MIKNKCSNQSKHYKLFSFIFATIFVITLVLISVSDVSAATNYKLNRIRVIASKGQRLAFVSICGYLKTGKYYCESTKSNYNWSEYNSTNWFMVTKPIEIAWRIYNDPNTKDLNIQPLSKATIPARKNGSSNEWTSLVGGRYKNNPYGGYRQIASYYLIKYSPLVTSVY